MKLFAYFVVFFTSCIVSISNASILPAPPNPFRSHPKTLDTLLATYDRREIPDGFANVSVDVFLRHIFLETKNDVPYMRLVFTLRQFWKDPRLAQPKDDKDRRDFTLSTGEDMGRIWTPDTFVNNDAFPESIRFDGHIPAMIKFCPCAKVSASIMVEKKVFCPVESELKSKDEVKCYLILASYGHTEDQIQYQWAQNITLPDMERLGPAFPKYTFEVEHKEWIQTVKTGDYSSLKMIFTWRKK